MSEIVPNHHSICDSQHAAFAFQSMNGLQAGQVFALDSSKTVLQFDAADGSNQAPPTRCLVIQGPNGVAVRTIQGEMAINDCIQQDAWMNVNDELSCGNARLRLIHQTEWAAGSTAIDRSDESPQVIDDDLEHDTRGDASGDSQSLGSTDEPESRFFSPITFENGPDSSIDGRTMCLSPDELRGLLEPTVYGADDAGYVDSSLSHLTNQVPTEAPLDASCDPVAATCDHVDAEIEPVMAIEPACAEINDFVLLPFDAETKLPCDEPTLNQPPAETSTDDEIIEPQQQVDPWADITERASQACSLAETLAQLAIENSPRQSLPPTSENSAWHEPQLGQRGCSHVEIVDLGAVGQSQYFFHQVVGGHKQEPCNDPLSCDLQPPTGVHGVIIH